MRAAGSDEGSQDLSLGAAYTGALTGTEDALKAGSTDASVRTSYLLKVHTAVGPVWAVRGVSRGSSLADRDWSPWTPGVRYSMHLVLGRQVWNVQAAKAYTK